MKLLRRLLPLMLALTLAGCGSVVSPSLHYDIDSPVSSYDPQIAENDSELLMAGNCFEGLLRKNLDGELRPGAAEDWRVSEDGLTYTFFLKRDMLWSDGETPLTAGDFVFGFRRLFDPNTDAPFRSDFFSIENSENVVSGKMTVWNIGVHAQDDYTLVITLARPDPFFLELLTAPAAAPCNEAFFLSTRGRYGSELKYSLFNGPYHVYRVNEGVYYRLSRNPEYSGDTAERPNVYLYFQNGPNYDASARLLENETDAAPVTYSQLPELRRRGFITTGDQDTVWVLLFNTENEFLSSQSIRRAIFYASDRAAMEPLLPGNLTMAWAYVPPAVTLSGESYRSLAGDEFTGFSYDPGMAHDLLEEGLAELGEDRLDTLTIACPPDYLSMMGLIQRSVQESLATFVNLEPVEKSQLNALVRSGDYDMALIPVTVKYDNPSAFFSMLAGENSLSALSVERLLSVVRKAGVSGTLEGAVDGYATAEQMLLQYMPMMPMFFETSYFACAHDISGLEYSPFGCHVYFSCVK